MSTKRSFRARLALTPALLAALAASARAEGGAPFVSALRQVSMEDHVDVRDPAWILETSGFKIADVVAELAGLLPGTDASVAVEAEYFLGRLGPRAAAAAPALTASLASSPDLDVRYEAVRALGRIGPAAKAAVPAVAAAASDANADLRAAAAEALGRIDPAGAVARAALTSGSNNKSAR
jgi:HEAT repeat protein